MEQHLIRGITAQLEKMPEGGKEVGGRAKGAFRKASLPPFPAALFPPPRLVCRHKRLALHKGQGQILFQKGADSSFVYVLPHTATLTRKIKRTTKSWQGGHLGMLCHGGLRIYLVLTQSVAPPPHSHFRVQRPRESSKCHHRRRRRTWRTDLATEHQRLRVAD